MGACLAAGFVSIGIVSIVLGQDANADGRQGFDVETNPHAQIQREASYCLIVVAFGDHNKVTPAQDGVLTQNFGVRAGVTLL